MLVETGQKEQKLSPTTLTFEGVNVGLTKQAKEFQHPQLGSVSKDVYSIWNPNYWAEIAKRIEDGQICAIYMMGNYGVLVKGSDIGSESTDSTGKVFEDIKKRPQSQNLVLFANPLDIKEHVDFNRMHGDLLKMVFTGKGETLYAGPQHNVFPVKDSKINGAFVKQDDQTVSFFWVPGHWGLEGLSGKLRKMLKNGHPGGSSLNVHGHEPCYTTDEFYEEMASNPDWIRAIDFIVKDEITEAANIGRSQTMVNLTEEKAEVIRLGSMTPEQIAAETGLVFSDKEDYLYASSLTSYDQNSNTVSDKKVEKVMAQIKRFGQCVSKNLAV